MNKNYLAFDLGGSAVKYALISNDGQITDQGQFATPSEGFAALLAAMVAITEPLKDKNPVAVAISAPGLVDNSSGIIGGVSAIPYIHHFKIKEVWQQAFGLPVAMLNDGKCAALAELEGGVASKVDDALLVVCGTGIGGAIIKNRAIHWGASLGAGEFGLMILDDAGHSWSQLASTARLVEAVATRKKISLEQLDGKKVYQLAESGDTDALQALKHFYHYMAKGIYNLQCVYDSPLIMIGGAISANPALIKGIEQQMQAIQGYNHDAAIIKPLIKACHWGNDANLRGAVVFLKKELQQ